MAAGSIRSHAHWPPPAARRFLSPRSTKRGPPAPRLPSAAIYVLDGFFQNCGDAYAKSDARPVIGDLNELAEWDVFCRRSGWAGGAAIHIDTGMNRLGMTLTEAQGIIPRINAGDHGITLVMSHLACAESLNHPLNAQAARDLSRDRQPVFRGAGIAVEFLGRLPRGAVPVRHGAARVRRSTASIRRPRRTIRCSRWSI